MFFLNFLFKSHIINQKTATAAYLNMNHPVLLKLLVLLLMFLRNRQLFPLCCKFRESPEKADEITILFVICKCHYCSPQIALPLIDCENNGQDLNTHFAYTTKNCPRHPSHDSYGKR